MRFTQKIGTLLLVAFLILWGLVMALSMSFQGMHVVLGCLAIAAGIFILLEK